MLQELIASGMSPKDKKELIEQVINSDDEFEDMIKEKLHHCFVSSAAISALVFMLMRSGQFEETLTQYFRTFRMASDKSFDKAFSEETFKDIMGEESLVAIIYKGLTDDEKKDMYSRWSAIRQAIYQDSVTEFISEHKTTIYMKVKEREQNNED